MLGQDGTDRDQHPARPDGLEWISRTLVVAALNTTGGEKREIHLTSPREIITNGWK